MKLNEIRDNAGAHTTKTRVGRGIGSGKGKTSGRGVKGQKARKSGLVRAGFEGGQNPLYRRLPMRGFNNANFTKRYCTVNLGTLQAMVDDGRLNVATQVTVAAVIAAGLTKKAYDGLKVLGGGELTAPLKILATAATASVAAKVKAAGGTLELLPQPEAPGRLKPKAERAAKA